MSEVADPTHRDPVFLHAGPRPKSNTNNSIPAMCLTYLCCRSCSNRGKRNNSNKTTTNDADFRKGSTTVNSESLVVATLSEQEQRDYDDLMHLARKREIRVTIRKSTQAGLAAGLSVMAGTIVAGPVGAMMGGALGTAMACKIAKNVVSLNDLLEQTPQGKRRELITAFRESFKEEFMETINGSPELQLVLSGGSVIGVMRYMVDREIVQSEQLERIDGVLRKIA